MLIYSRDWANFTPAMVERLCAIPTLVAWKDGQETYDVYRRSSNLVGDRLHWIGGAGDDMVAAYYSTGIRTFSSSIATVAPQLSLKLHELAEAGNSEALTELLGQCGYHSTHFALVARATKSRDESIDGHGRSERWSSAPAAG